MYAYSVNMATIHKTTGKREVQLQSKERTYQIYIDSTLLTYIFKVDGDEMHVTGVLAVHTVLLIHEVIT